MSEWDSGEWDVSFWDAISLTFPQLQYLVAFNNGAFDDPTLITSVATPAGAVGASNVWTDITPWVMSDSGERGKAVHATDTFEAGTRQLRLDNRLGQFTPWNASSPYAGLINPRVPVQVRAIVSGTTYYRFTGQADSWAPDWVDPTQQPVTLHVSDAFRVFNQANITTNGYAALVLSNSPSGYWRLNDPAGSTTLADSSGNGHPGTVVQDVTLGQTGAMVVDPASSAAFSVPVTGVQEISWPQVWGTISGGTIEYWYNSNDTTSGLDMQVVNTCAMAAFTGPVSVSLDVSFPAGGIIVDVAGNPGSPFALHTTQDGNWHHIAVTFTSGASSSNELATINYYFDGVNVLSQTNVLFTPASNVPNGVRVFNSSTSTFSLQDVAFYPSALTGAQIAAHFNQATIPQEGTGARINEILTVLGWPSGARAIDTGASSVQAVTSSLTSTSVLSHLQSVEATEAGALFMDGEGRVQFLARSTLFSSTNTTTSQATFGDNVAGGDIPFQPSPSLARDDIDLYNEAVATRSGGHTQIVDNPTSIAKYGRNTWQPAASLLGLSDLEVLNLCQYIVAKYSTPVDRLAAITVDMLSINAQFPTLVPTILALDLMYRVTVERVNMPGGGTAFSQVSIVETITEDITPSSWKITFGMAVADPAFWILGTSQLGTNTRLAF